MESNPDFRDLFRCLNDERARYLVVGAYAVIYHTEPRYTKDLGIWVEPNRENAEWVWRALAAFGAPVDELSTADLCDPDLVYQVGMEPNRFDILMGIPGLSFEQAWKGRVSCKYAGEPIRVLGLDDTIASKRAAGRPEDLLDLSRLEAKRRRSSGP